jgi:hypothetical protein
MSVYLSISVCLCLPLSACVVVPVLISLYVYMCAGPTTGIRWSINTSQIRSLTASHPKFAFISLSLIFLFQKTGSWVHFSSAHLMDSELVSFNCDNDNDN